MSEMGQLELRDMKFALRRPPQRSFYSRRKASIGLVLGVLAAHFFTSQTGLSSLVSPKFTLGVFAWGLAFALGVGLLGAVYPTWRALSLSPIEALRRE